MPLVEVSMIEGRTAQQIRSLHEAMTAAVETTLGVPRESVWVVIRTYTPLSERSSRTLSWLFA